MPMPMAMPMALPAAMAMTMAMSMAMSICLWLGLWLWLTNHRSAEEAVAHRLKRIIELDIGYSLVRTSLEIKRHTRLVTRRVACYVRVVIDVIVSLRPKGGWFWECSQPVGQGVHRGVHRVFTGCSRVFTNTSTVFANQYYVGFFGIFPDDVGCSIATDTPFIILKRGKRWFGIWDVWPSVILKLYQAPPRSFSYFPWASVPLLPSDF